MASPEHSSHTTKSVAALELELSAVNQKLELADENENPLERTQTRESLLELQAWLEGEINTKSR